MPSSMTPVLIWRSLQINTEVDKVFLGLSKRFEDPSPPSFRGPSLTNADVSEKPLRALKLITRLSTTTVATKSYELFGTIMQSGATVKRKMKAARLALHAAYRPGLESVPPVGDPKHIFDFLCFHIGPCVGREERTHAVSSAMRAIDSASNGPTPQARTWRIEAADELLAGFRKSPHPGEFEWWYGVLWLHYGELEHDVRKRVDEIARNGDDRVDLKQCRTAIEKEIERVKELDGVTNIVALEETYSTLSTFIDHREKVREECSGIWTVFISFFPSRRVYQFYLSHGQLIPFI